MKNPFIKLIVAAVCVAGASDATAQFNWGKALQGAVKAGQALTITDAQMAKYVKESVDYMDTQNKVADEKSPYTIRLKKLTEGVTDADGIPLNFKVYEVSDINAFACPDGSVRVFSSLMDIMNDDELMGIIGHEIGHVMKHHSKNAYRTQLLTDAAKDGLSATGGTIGKLSDSTLGSLASSLVNAKYSQKQENEADNCGYDFLVAHGKNPWGMVMAFEKFQQMENGSNANSNYMQKMFSSHPDTQSRIKKMTKRCQKDGYTRPASK